VVAGRGIGLLRRSCANCPPPPDLRIKFYGENVADATKTLAIGEVAQFSVEVGPGSPNVSITGVQWSQPPNAYKDYTFTIQSGAPVGLSGGDLKDSFAVRPIRRSLLRLVWRCGIGCGLHVARLSLRRSCRMPRGLPRGFFTRSGICFPYPACAAPLTPSDISSLEKTCCTSSSSSRASCSLSSVRAASTSVTGTLAAGM